MTITKTARIWAIVPAAGSGARMGGETPKQYLELNGCTVLEHTLARLAKQPGIARVVVAVAADDTRFAALAPVLPSSCVAVHGGRERCHSVLNALVAVADEAAANDWALVHDAARPCVRTADVSRMAAALEDSSVGGILALPVRDTLKRSDAQQGVAQTIDRGNLWHALTPQMFRFGLLRDALQAALEAGELVTDEAQAIERAGFTPRLVPGHGDNLKITYPEDLALAALILAAQGAADTGEPE